MNINLTLIMQAVSFALFIWFTAKFVWPPMLRAIENRQKQIADGLAAAERGKKDLELASHRAADILRQAKQQAQEIIARAEKQGAQVVDAKKGEARAEANKIVAAAKGEIEQEAQRAREALRSSVASLAVAGAEKILRREVDTKVHADLLRSIEAQL